ncbi:hypothetical protein GGF41_004144, partial [Coemansia sp. RSA 2531]
MNISFATISCLAVVVLAQTDPEPTGDTTSPAPNVPDTSSLAPKGADTPVTNVASGQLLQLPQVAQMPSSLTQSLLSRLISYFDMSRVSSVDTAMPVMITQVFDSTMNKITHLSMNVVQSGDVWYLPVCTIDSITAAGTSAAPPVPESCQYGIQLAPVPQNAMRMMLR